MNIGEKIKFYRKNLKLTQEDLAKRSGLSRNAIYNYEKGKRQPGFPTLDDIAEALEISRNELIGENSTKIDEFKTIFVDDLIQQLESYRGGKVACVFIGNGNISMDIDLFEDIRIEKAWDYCQKENDKDISIIIE